MSKLTRHIRRGLAGLLVAFGLTLGLCLLTVDATAPVAGAALPALSAQGGVTVTLPITVTAAGARWRLYNNGGTTLIAPPDIYGVNGSPGLTVLDCCEPNQYFGGKANPAFDYGMTLRVGDPSISNPLALPIVALPGGGDVLSDTNRISTPAVLLSGLNVTLEYYFPPSTPTIRTLASFANSSGADITVQVYWASKEGMQDSERFVARTSSGDATFTTGDQWVVVGDTGGVSPVNTHVLFGPVGPAITPVFVTQTVFRSGGESGGIGAKFLLSVPAGQTRRLIFFNQVSADTNAAIARTSAFNLGLNKNSELLAGLGGVPPGEIVNWRAVVYEVFLPLVRR